MLIYIWGDSIKLLVILACVPFSKVWWSLERIWLLKVQKGHTSKITSTVSFLKSNVQLFLNQFFWKSNRRIFFVIIKLIFLPFSKDFDYKNFQIFIVKVYFLKYHWFIFSNKMTSGCHIWKNSQKKVIFFGPNAIKIIWEYAFQLSQKLEGLEPYYQLRYTRKVLPNYNH